MINYLKIKNCQKTHKSFWKFPARNLDLKTLFTIRHEFHMFVRGNRPHPAPPLIVDDVLSHSISRIPDDTRRAGFGAEPYDR